MGGKTFKDHDRLLASRIPQEKLKEVAETVEEMIGHFFTKFRFATNVFDNKEDHGDIDFIVLPASSTVRQEVRRFFESYHCLTKANGEFEHILLPYKGNHYQIDLIYCNQGNFKNQSFFYCQPTVFNAIVGQLARSIGFKFSSSEGFLLFTTNSKGQNLYFKLTDDPSKGMKILGLEFDEENIGIYESSQKFAEWIMSSPRFDSDRFRKSRNMNSHRDAHKDTFTGEVFEFLDKSDIKAKIPPTIISLKEFDISDLEEKLEFELEIIDDKSILRKLVQFFKKSEEKEKKIVTGDQLKEWGYIPGPIFKKIFEKVNSTYGQWINTPSEDVVKAYVLCNFPLEGEEEESIYSEI